MSKATVLTAIALLGSSASALAADNGIYFGGSIGQAQVKVDDIAGISTADFDADDTGFKIIAGIRPLDWFGVEANYVNFGEPEDTVLGQRLKADGDGISAFAVGFLAVGPVDLFAKGGLISWDSDISGGDGGTDLAYGIGAQFRVWSISIRAEYEVFDAEDIDDLNMLSIGATFTFL